MTVWHMNVADHEDGTIHQVNREEMQNFCTV